MLGSVRNSTCTGFRNGCARRLSSPPDLSTTLLIAERSFAVRSHQPPLQSRLPKAGDQPIDAVPVSVIVCPRMPRLRSR